MIICGRVIHSSAPLSYSIVDGMDVRDNRVHNYPPRWNGAPSQDLQVIRRNHQTGEVSLTRCVGALFLIGAATRRAHATQSTPSARDGAHPADIPRRHGGTGILEHEFEEPKSKKANPSRVDNHCES
jgi:hypothetical protein